MRQVEHFEGTCDVCGAPISMDWDYSDGIIDVGIEEDGRVYTWMRHHATAPPNANADCARYFSRVWRVDPPDDTHTKAENSEK